MIKAIALDNNPASLDLIKKYCSQAGYIDLLKCFTRQEEAAAFLNNYPVDLLFVEINLPAVAAMKFSKWVPQGTMVICATTNSAFAVDAFNHNVLDYLLSPFSFERFVQAAEKAKAWYRFIRQRATGKIEDISLRVDYALVKVPLVKIMYIEGLDDYIRIFMHDQKPLVTRMTMKALEDKLPNNEFARVHRSYIVPVNKINFIRNKVVHIDKYKIPVGVCYEQKFYSTINNTSNTAANHS